MLQGTRGAAGKTGVAGAPGTKVRPRQEKLVSQKWDKKRWALVMSSLTCQMKNESSFLSFFFCVKKN